jgi:hypothetical protein
MGFSNPPCETDVCTGCFLTQFCVDVNKYELYVRITEIIAGKFQSHALLFLHQKRMVLQTLLTTKDNGKKKKEIVP